MSTHDEKQDYKKNGAEYIQDAFVRGDWSVINMVRHSMISTGESYNPVFSILSISSLAGAAETFYGLTKLMQLGATGNYADQLENELRIPYEQPDLVTNPFGKSSLDDKQIRQATQWAEET